MPRRFYLPQTSSSHDTKPAPQQWTKWIAVAVGGLMLVLLLVALRTYLGDDGWFVDRLPTQSAEPSAIAPSTPVTRTPTSEPASTTPGQTPVSGVVSNEQEDGLSTYTETVFEHAIRLQVMNGCGIKGITRTVTPQLRARGFDVRETRNASRFDYPQSLVIDRVGNAAMARAVADSLGIDPARITSEPSATLVDIDVTVVIGMDYERLKLNR